MDPLPQALTVEDMVARRYLHQRVVLVITDPELVHTNGALCCLTEQAAWRQDLRRSHLFAELEKCLCIVGSSLSGCGWALREVHRQGVECVQGAGEWWKLVFRI
jgi:hypothetical protein